MIASIEKVAGLIPARKGSKRVTGKNIALMDGKPLMQYTIDAALASNLKHVYLTTDYLPSEVGFVIPPDLQWISRPKELALDGSSYFGYINHFFKVAPRFDIVVLLQPTCPLRAVEDINKALDMYLRSKQDTLMSCIRLDSKNKIYKSNGATVYGSELTTKEPMFFRNSSVYIFSKKFFEKYNTIYAKNGVLLYEMPFYRSIDINTPEDFRQAEKIIKANRGEFTNAFGIDSI